MRLSSKIAQLSMTKGIGWLSRAYLSRNRKESDNLIRLNIYSHYSRIPFSQVYPYIYFEKELLERYNTSIRVFNIEDYTRYSKNLEHFADIFIIQPWFTEDKIKVSRILSLIKNNNPVAVTCFLDSFAHNDLRFAEKIDPYTDFYVKKSIFNDKSLYTQAQFGDTNLTNYYGSLFGLKQELVDWKVPLSTLRKLRLSPNFFTSPNLLPSFKNGDPPLFEERDINMHARLSTKGSEWYSAMRQKAIDEVLRLKLPHTVIETGVGWTQYMTEMHRSKLCFSPFGYGELCWRDIEAFQTGAVLVKPDMSHLATLPDLYVPYETYLPVAWDFSDLQEVASQALADDALRERIATTAFQRVASYLRSGAFIDDISFMFEPIRRADS